MQYAARWAAERGMVLDEALTMRDEGLSAYHQQHIRTGALGVFMAAIGAGKIAPGSVLIVEGLDRLSRAEPLQAQAQLAQIIHAGITVVTASDGREYTRDGLRTNPMDLVYSLLVMIRAHEESDTKSRRVIASIRKLCEGWTAGTYRGPIRNGTDPLWICREGDTWALDEAHAVLVLAAIDLYTTGHGPVRIARRLAEMRPPGDNDAPMMEARDLYKLIRRRALYGCKELQVDGETYQLDDYYPALMTRQQWDELQLLADDRGRRRVRGDLPHIITGSAITRCGYCGTPMSGQHLGKKPRLPDGRMRDSYRRLLCGGKTRGNPCSVPGSCSVAPIERAILRHCSDQLLLSDLLRGDDGSAAHRADLAEARTKSAELQRQISRLTDALADDDGTAPLAILRRVRDLEQQLASTQQRIEAAERALQSTATRGMTHSQAERWAALAEAVELQDYDARALVRQMIADTFEQITVWHHGLSGDDHREVVIVLLARGGRPRMLTIDRWSGELISGCQMA